MSTAIPNTPSSPFDQQQQLHYARAQEEASCSPELLEKLAKRKRTNGTGDEEDSSAIESNKRRRTEALFSSGVSSSSSASTTGILHNARKVTADVLLTLLDCCLPFIPVDVLGIVKEYNESWSTKHVQIYIRANHAKFSWEKAGAEAFKAFIEKENIDLTDVQALDLSKLNWKDLVTEENDTPSRVEFDPKFALIEKLMPHLKKLKLDQGQNLVRSHLTPLAIRCFQQLTELDISHNADVNDAFMKELLDDDLPPGLPPRAMNLTVLKVTGTQVSMELINQLKTKWPRLTIIS